MTTVLKTDPIIKTKILEKQSEFCKLFTNLHRLQILNVLMDKLPPSILEINDLKETKKELTVSEILETIQTEFNTDLSQTTLSQHLAILRKNGAVKTRRVANNIYYKIANPKLLVTCGIVREIVLDMLRNEQELLGEE